uniref:FAD-binding domain-containing protein n=1 Tax=Eucampia antarctica TaxID=49252 RepID=A0A7S2S6L4_9STRA|eukprot:CAMPEP_0197824026 /NCGR_PEP_ID=MMETSP1437-20131217/1341_1 /TAXON_ID=49252 ORGANISM="Eucampia antarctica, Strain CCMP1452" /NCGR_SAMPLE_ID=MMETSP1437 /ASSEMBLY_ACC=CAM_ASM_001096 /LENGTH=418 /DNA_ID=CAMNT_0043423497 /DNA_START=33 /DNA_END=1289 /DNA_ORIENTATION=+
MTENNIPNVIICGGGPGGLLASILLNNIGIKATVLEKAPEPDQWSTKSYSMVCGEKGQAALDRGGCLESAKEVGNVRSCIYMLDGQSGKMKVIPKQQSTHGIGFSRPLLVECIEKIAVTLPHVTLKRGTGISQVAIKDDTDERGLEVHLEDGTVMSATHVIGADGKWSKVRQSFPSLNSQAKMVSCPSFGVSLFTSSVPEGWKENGTHVIKAPEECMFYVIASRLPTGGLSISMVCYDQTLEKYPWLEPPADLKTKDYGKGGWEDEYSAIPSGGNSDAALSDHLEQLFQETIPSFYDMLDKDIFKSARINHRVSWLQMSASEEGKKVSYSTEDGLVALIGDAAHAMTPSMGEGGNSAMESAVKLADAVISAMKEKQESVCSIDTLSEALVQYGLSRPLEVQPIQEMSAARNNKKPSIK